MSTRERAWLPSCLRRVRGGVEWELEVEVEVEVEVAVEVRSSSAIKQQEISSRGQAMVSSLLFQRTHLRKTGKSTC